MEKLMHREGRGWERGHTGSHTAQHGDHACPAHQSSPQTQVRQPPNQHSRQAAPGPREDQHPRRYTASRSSGPALRRQGACCWDSPPPSVAASTLSVCSSDLSYGCWVCLPRSWGSCTGPSWQGDDCPESCCEPPCCAPSCCAPAPCPTLVCTPVSGGCSPCQSACTSWCTPSCCQLSSCQPSCCTSSPCQQACCVPVCCGPVCSGAAPMPSPPSWLPAPPPPPCCHPVSCMSLPGPPRGPTPLLLTGHVH
ncbi:hypothetical protein MC885_013527 [Smutsia gigantea]|nr:hypothetical protein MC885_013527 [Smutsia gigantea]